MTTSSIDDGSWANWVGNQSFSPRQIVRVDSEADVQREVAKAAADRYGIRTVGTGHSFTPIVETDVLLDTSPLRGLIDVDPGRLTVTAGPKTTIGDFGDPLWEHGLALANQGDIDTQAIAGAIATATHGSGLKQPNLSAVLEGARIVDGSGNVMEISRDVNTDVLPALQTSIGLLGIMTEVTLKVVPAYNLHARVDIMKYDEVMDRFQADIEEYRHFGLFWMPTEASAALYNLHDAGADDCVVKRYREVEVGTSPEGLPDNERIDRCYRIYPMVYDPNFHEVEYFLPIEQTREIMDGMRRLMLDWLPLSVYPLEIRVVAADEAWLSPNYQRDNLVVSISGEPGTDYWPYLRACDALFAEFGGRPHWGKLHFMTADRIAGLFPRYQDFLEMRRRFDPNGTFLNSHLRPLFE
ncbi:MAG TPA: D-arabinono-1,4-lactone oxidase [Acidimicrobiia bacterium]|nr:D-arabinono-1,4-lactone oxidase [Acidimicrobiia bacterium]